MPPVTTNSTHIATLKAIVFSSITVNFHGRVTKVTLPIGNSPSVTGEGCRFHVGVTPASW